MTKQTIFKFTGEKPGKTVAIFSGVHGDEIAGQMAVDYLLANLKVEQGTVYLVYANPRAIEKNVRYTETNLNRNFLSMDILGDSYEEQRAKELMKVLDRCDALLDLHAYNEPFGNSTPFAICESDCFDIVKNFDVDTVVTNIDSFEKGGSDGYMFNNGKIGICVELGAIETPEEFVALGIKTAYQFLQYFGLVEQSYKNDTRDQTLMKVTNIYKKQTSNFTFTRQFKTFDFIKAGEKICNDGGDSKVAEVDQYILFPKAEHDIGIEVFLSASKI